MTAQTTEMTGYVDYDTALTAVRTIVADTDIPAWLLNTQALMLASSDYQMSTGYRLNHALLNDPEHLAKFTGTSMYLQTALGAAFIRAEDPTSGRRSHVASIAQADNDTVIVNFADGSHLTASPAPASDTNPSAILCTDSRRPDEAKRISWIGHDRFALLMVDAARRRRRQTANFSIDHWLSVGYRDQLGTVPAPGPTAYPQGDAQLDLTAQHESRAFKNRLLTIICHKAVEWAAVDGIELTVNPTTAPHQAEHPALLAALAHLRITCNGPAHLDHSWTIEHD